MRPKNGFGPTASGPLAALLALVVLLSGCDFFSTKDFSPKPDRIRAFSDSFGPGDTLAFRVTEYLQAPGSRDAETDRTARTLRFLRAPESLQRGGGWTTLALRVTSFPSGALIEEGLCHLRFEDSGLVLQGEDSTRDGGAADARYYPLKVTAGAAAGSGAFLSLPSAFILGASWVQSLGVLTVAREIEDTDTLGFKGHLEESWRIAESVRDGDSLLARGSFWYGASGLLKGEQTWPFETRGADGSVAAVRELRRELVRL